MKQTLFLLLAAIAGTTAFNACTSEEPVPESDSNATGNAIRFAASTELPSRAEDLTTNNLTQFKVSAYTGTESAPSLFMDNVTVSKNSNNVWTYSPVKYWPATPVDFYAYAPGDWASADGVLSGVTYNNFAGDTDIIYATAMDMAGTTNAENAQVVFNFRHALSKVTINMSSSNADLTVKVTNVAMSNIKMSGKFQFPSATTAAGSTDAATRGTWSGLGDSYTAIMYMSQRTDEVVTLTTSPVNLATVYDNAHTYMLPQPLTFRSNGMGSDNALAIMCSIYDTVTGERLWPNDHTPSENLVPGSTNGDGILRLSLGTSQFQSWEAGYHYIYNVVVNANPEMGTIQFGAPTVDTYVDVETNYE